MKQVFSLFTLAIALLACNKNEMNLRPVNPVDRDGNVVITATLSPKSNGVKAVSDGGDKIIASWATSEHLAILYEVGGVKKMADAEIIDVDAEGKATINFSVDGSTPDDTPCSIIYPLSACKDDYSGVKEAAEFIGNQDGTLNVGLDVRVGAGSIQVSTPDLEVTTQPAAQFAIFKFTIRSGNSTTPINANPLVITVDGQHYTVTPATATDVLYVALPAVSGKKVSFEATDDASNNFTCSKASVSFAAGNYYQTTLKMRQYVLMGDGLKWAVCNIGAELPHEIGDYYSWGSVTTQTVYNWPHYRFVPSGSTNYYRMFKYTIPDNDTDCAWYQNGVFVGDNGDGVPHKDLASYDYEDDTARQIWGSSWRMPTYAEWKVLLNSSKFNWERTTDYNGTGVTGFVVTSKVSGYQGNSIFFPSSGYWFNTSKSKVNVEGSYWSGTLNDTAVAFYLYIGPESGTSGHTWAVSIRSTGRTVRAVME
jgi:hypothetical protein